ncbi:MAG: two-component system response regulator [Planctomycetota bacterium]|nr:MAG: two-component system response regulator [Planctomycetota bacterium]
MPNKRSIHFLVIDDDDIDREAVKRAFKKEKISNPIIEAENGVEAFNFLNSKDKDYFEHNPVIILLDLNMPKMNGIEFLTKLREDPNLKRIIVFVMSTSDDDEDKLKAYNLNIAGYILKGRVNEGISKSILMIDAFWKIIEMPPY